MPVEVLHQGVPHHGAGVGVVSLYKSVEVCIDASRQADLPDARGLAWGLVWIDGGSAWPAALD